MADSNPSANPPLDADDPRISEWIDGRLTPSEAAAIERAVAASPELTLLVDDLRTIRSEMRSPSGDALPVDLSDRVLAAITSSGSAAPHRALASRQVTPALSRGRRLPWLGLLGALAAGVLVTVVVNLPNDGGREVALAPETVRDSKEFGGAAVRHEVNGRALTEEAVDREVDALEEGENRFADVSPVVKSLEDSSNAPKDESVALFSGGVGGGVRGESAQVSAAPAAPAPAVTAPTTPAEASRLTEAAARSPEKHEVTPSAAPQLAKRAKVDLAGVLVIAVTNASERRTLDRLVAESGLEATPEKDHLALVGKTADVDAFLQELTRVGLVSAVPARRAAEAGKLKADERRDARTTTLIVRVVERKGKSSAPVQSGEGEAKP